MNALGHTSHEFKTFSKMEKNKQLRIEKLRAAYQHQIEQVLLNDDIPEKEQNAIIERMKRHMYNDIDEILNK